MRLLQKLDLAFSSLIEGVDVETGTALSGFGNGRTRLTTTEKVRIRGLVERTRVAVVEVAAKDSVEDPSRAVNIDQSTDDEFGLENDLKEDRDENEDEDDAGWEMGVARVYERTVVNLGAALDDGFG